MAIRNLPFKCEVILPDPAAQPHGLISRWSDIGVERPALVVIPNSEEDIIEALSYAQKEGLRIIPAGGGHGSFVPITPNTLYLDLKKLNTVVLDKDAGQITAGGGALTGQIVKACTDGDMYTIWPNSNALGITGYVLGGGNNAFAGLHGMAVDNVIAIRLITAAGDVLELSRSSRAEESALFNALCGAGHGLGIVTSLTLKAFPVAKLNLTDNQVWLRRLVFPGAAIEMAADTYAKLQPVFPRQNLVLVFARSPPGTPFPGAPIIMLTASYYGPSEDGEKAAKLLFDDEITSKAVQAGTLTIPLAAINDGFEVFNSHGGYKDISSAWLKVTPPAAITSAFQRWLEFTNAYEDASRCVTILGTNNTEKQIEISKTPEGQARYFESRDRQICMFAMGWVTKRETIEPMMTFARDVKEIFQRFQPESDSPRTFANNIQMDTKLSELHTDDRIRELKRIKKLWDATGLFWSPYLE